MATKKQNQLVTLKAGDLFDDKRINTIARGNFGSVLIEFTDGSVYALVKEKIIELEDIDEVAWHPVAH